MPQDGLSPLPHKRERRVVLFEHGHDLLVELLDPRPRAQSVRHVFYRMTDPRLLEPVEKSERRGYVCVQNRLKLLRLSDRVPYAWITDATRQGFFVNTYHSASDFLFRVAGLYRAPLWKEAMVYVEVWCESRSIAGVIEGDCEELAVSLYPAGGFSSMTLAWEAAQYIANEVAGTDKRIVILYIGDYDPAGVLIDRDIEAKLRKHLAEAGVFDIDFRRIAINEDQIRQYDLPTKPRKMTDRRALHISTSVEAEAMPAAILRRLLREEIEALLPPRALAVAKAAEESEREYLLNMAKRAERRGR
jgi:hypothetical protein